MKVGELIEKLKELPEDCNIYFCDYDKTYDAEVMWDNTKEEWESGEYTDEPYIYLTERYTSYEYI